MQKRLVIFFGKTGAGKNCTAELFARKFGFYFYDADQDLTEEMKEAIAAGRIFTDAMRDRYFEVIIEKTRELLGSHSRIALAQGLFKNKQRRSLMRAFPFAEFIWVDAVDNLIEERIVARNSRVTLEYARRINPLFEVPDFKCEKIINNGGFIDLENEVRKLGVKLKGL